MRKIVKKTMAVSLLALTALGAAAQQAEREAFNAARRDGSIEAYEQFLAAYPRGYYTEQARLNRDDAVVRAYCRADVTLDLLVDYIEINQPHAPRIRTFYANLVNQPTHSYRYSSCNLGFNGTTGTVKETVVTPDATSHNTFVFDERGLLVSETTDGLKSEYTYSYDNLRGYRLASVTCDGNTETYEADYDALDRIVDLRAANDQYRFTYNELGSLTEVQHRDFALYKTLTYNDGTLIRLDERGGGEHDAYRYSYDFNADTGRRYLNAIRTIGAGDDETDTVKVTYTLDARGRYSTATLIDDSGNTVMTITRTYDN